MGPAPFEYFKITGEPVPGWQPSDMLATPTQRGASPLLWSPLGPRPIVNEYWSGDDDASGRVVSIAPHPSDANTVYIGSASGGVWKTTDAGLNWSPLTDELSTLNHGSVAIDPNNPETIYAGTGEYQSGTNGDGLFRSTDGGITWNQVATAAQVGSRCSKVQVDPTDSQRIHITGNSGYARSTDGGGVWSTRLAGNCSDLVINPSNPQILYVGKHSDGVYRSTDGGDTLVKLAGGLPTTGLRRILVAISASNPNVVYTAIINSSSGLLGFYKSTDGGDTWVKKTATPNFPSPQGSYDAFIGVDPLDSEAVFAGGVFPSYAVAGVIRTSNGGDSWTDVTIGALGGQLHPDQHTCAFGPDGTLWVGNDGGVWRSPDSGDTWVDCNTTLTLTQNYNISLHPTDSSQVIGGTQDNGTVQRPSGNDGWPQILAGDGGFSAFDFTNGSRRYVTYVGLDVYRLFGTLTTNITGPWGSDPVNFIAPLVMDPNDAKKLLGGTNRIWRTLNAHAGASWTAISTNAVGGGGVVNAIAVAVGASNTIYSGSNTGKVFYTTDAAVWTDRSAGLPAGSISDIMIDPTNPATAFVAFYNTTGNRVLRTDNSGASWTNVTGSLPSGVAARALAIDWRFDPPPMFVGAGSGVYSSLDGGATWIKDGADLPNVNVGDLAIDATNNIIYVGTYGRGVWMSDLPDASIDVTPPAPNPMSFAILPNPAGTNAVIMQSLVATDTSSPPVEYVFEETTGATGGTSSAWQSSVDYTDSDLLANTIYAYRVSARDSASIPNQTSWSATLSATTFIETPTAVVIGNVTTNSVELTAIGPFTNLTQGTSGLFFDSTTAGGDGGLNAWTQSESTIATSLQANKEYTFRVKARNRNGIETVYGPSVTVRTKRLFQQVPL